MFQQPPPQPQSRRPLSSSSRRGKANLPPRILRLLEQEREHQQKLQQQRQQRLLQLKDNEEEDNTTPREPQVSRSSQRSRESKEVAVAVEKKKKKGPAVPTTIMLKSPPDLMRSVFLQELLPPYSKKKTSLSFIEFYVNWYSGILCRNVRVARPSSSTSTSFLVEKTAQMPLLALIATQIPLKSIDALRASQFGKAILRDGGCLLSSAQCRILIAALCLDMRVCAWCQYQYKDKMTGLSGLHRRDHQQWFCSIQCCSAHTNHLRIMRFDALSAGGISMYASLFDDAHTKIGALDPASRDMQAINSAVAEFQLE